MTFKYKLPREETQKIIFLNGLKIMKSNFSNSIFKSDDKVSEGFVFSNDHKIYFIPYDLSSRNMLVINKMRHIVEFISNGYSWDDIYIVFSKEISEKITESSLNSISMLNKIGVNIIGIKSLPPLFKIENFYSPDGKSRSIEIDSSKKIIKTVIGNKPNLLNMTLISISLYDSNYELQVSFTKDIDNKTISMIAFLGIKILIKNKIMENISNETSLENFFDFKKGFIKDRSFNHEKDEEIWIKRKSNLSKFHNKLKKVLGNYLESKAYKVIFELKGIDVIAFNKNEIIIYEVKSGDNEFYKAIGQLLTYKEIIESEFPKEKRYIKYFLLQPKNANMNKFKEQVLYNNFINSIYFEIKDKNIKLNIPLP